MNRFIKFGQSDSVDTFSTLYAIDMIESICLCDETFEQIEGAFKILLFLKGEEKGIPEVFEYYGPHEAIEAQKEARNRFNELLALLNS